MRKQLWIVRHGQAAHNPRAEAAKEAGCSHDEFLEHMRLDDVLDAPTTELGKAQARELRAMHSLSHLELIVSSPLSRALETADICRSSV
jgi:broad specificity phosphatase PhoE